MRGCGGPSSILGIGRSDACPQCSCKDPWETTSTRFPHATTTWSPSLLMAMAWIQPMTVSIETMSYFSYATVHIGINNAEHGLTPRLSIFNFKTSPFVQPAHSKDGLVGSHTNFRIGFAALYMRTNVLDVVSWI